MVFTGGVGVEAEVELVFPAELESGLAQGIVSVLGGWVAFGKIGSVGCDLVGDNAFFNIILVGQPKVPIRERRPPVRGSFPRPSG